MSEEQKKFIKDSEKIAFDIEHRKKIIFNISKYDDAVLKGKKIYADLDSVRKRVAYLKGKSINNLEQQLISFQRNFESRGGKVIFCENSKEVIESITEILESKNAKSVVKMKSMITEEVEFNDSLEKIGVESIETDLGEYIVQMAGEKPYHIITPAMHKSKEDVAKLFHEKLGTPLDSTPEELTAVVREILRDKFFNADVGVTGANFLIADTGSVALTENEGNGMMSFSFPKTHIVIAGIEKMIPSMTDLAILWPLLATHGTGQQMTVYNSILSGPRQSDEEDGPEEMYVILLNNNRTNLLGEDRLRVVLSCIRCGACLNGCPVYKNIGGYTYNTTYSGPIGSVISPYLNDLEKYKHLSFASSLCGNCSEVCPVNIPIHKLLLYIRKDSVEQNYTTWTERTSIKGWKTIMKNRKLMDFGSAGMKNWLLRKFVRKAWGSKRELPVISEKSFRKRMKIND